MELLWETLQRESSGSTSSSHILARVRGANLASAAGEFTGLLFC